MHDNTKPMMFHVLRGEGCCERCGEGEEGGASLLKLINKRLVEQVRGFISMYTLPRGWVALHALQWHVLGRRDAFKPPHNNKYNTFRITISKQGKRNECITPMGQSTTSPSPPPPPKKNTAQTDHTSLNFQEPVCVYSVCVLPFGLVSHF